ncbi:ABC-2 type transport system ATP-binding protein [Clostridium acetobutylicum]|uniref:ABC-type multidrug transport system (Daunorubicin resistance), ATPase component n=1 Tax=Clostridium acetobutylicum (strain ATCC 824 / DSM 792 / JCM 1419 / IAM 19013 / LMG 5710 / NBRC 13948 / NRRL B-527 / VKM B-1787 / 2291 / W) TaxID=272562 RepID=Q97KT3_CLOAB|nr:MULTISPECIES: ABC transporter ATP-binding protein [Clostridium]AAK78809.1 ABC-type multidrug transport system (daunorubicin resistance), ATPase component [Clostridium acetobutylicum ATCC 824]ADZ19883.1 ABC-type multidrug transport system (daunorubicin resistance), ATPase component [Clostridium acetobutylicum EA 2018]AEI34614.1 ABC-type multidrug transport system (daunorubicin resistance), ATPase component [Clostridium acetobutylicum DSM 1731]AWV80527.1 ABC transporter ATP-binding protein [Cl
MNYILKVKNIEKSYGERKAVKGISFNVEDGEVLGFLGPNGAGKSTSINIISTVVDFDKGDIFFKDKDIIKNKNFFKSNLGVVPQDIAVFSDLTAYNNVKFFCSLYGFRGKRLKENVEEALKFVGLWERKNDLPTSFSGGMKRRLNIACAIAHKPKLLIMDEPTVGIDPQSRNNILETVKKLNENGTTIIYTSHYMEEVESVCNKIIIMDEGEIIEDGSKDFIKAKYNKENLEEIFLCLTGKALRD